MILEIPIKTVSESNCSEHWSVKSKRHRQQQFFVRAILEKEAKGIVLPCLIILTRMAPRSLDSDDNLPLAFKWIKDEIGAFLLPEKVVHFLEKKVYKGKLQVKKRTNKGHADSDQRISWQYAQEKSKIMGIRIEIICS